MRIILIHGLGQNAAAWNGVTSQLPQEYTISVPELTQITAGDCTYNSLYKGFQGYCAGFSEPMLLCGLSLGAVLALNYAADFPERVCGLVLFAPQFKMPKGLLKFQTAVFHLMPKTTFKEMGFTKSGVIQLTASMQSLDFTDSIPRIACPTAIACGEKDRTNMKAATELYRLLPNAELSVIPGCGHEVNLGDPAGAALLITNIIKCCKIKE